MIFLTSCFFSQERRFFHLEYDETHFAGPYWQNKNWKMANLDQNHGLTPLEKCQYFAL